MGFELHGFLLLRSSITRRDVTGRSDNPIATITAISAFHST